MWSAAALLPLFDPLAQTPPTVLYLYLQIFSARPNFL
jgi:hypothetical protein